MAQLHIGIDTPSGTATSVPVVPRSFQVSGWMSVNLGRGESEDPGARRVSVTFGAGATVTATVQGQQWHCNGTLPDSLVAGAVGVVTVSAETVVWSFHNPSEPDPQTVVHHATFQVRLQNPPPQPSIDALPDEVVAPALPHSLTITGSVADSDSNVVSVQCALDLGAFEAAQSTASGWSRWRKSYSLSAGLHRFTVRATDQGGNVVSAERFVFVRAANAPTPVERGSVTTWARIEPSCRDAAKRTGPRARVFDPLWMLARQWQMGEFQGRDGGTPVQARVRATSALLTRCHLGPPPVGATGQPYDPLKTPLDALVERRPMRAASQDDPAMLPLAVEAGLQFLRRVAGAGLSKSYRSALIARFALTANDNASTDPPDESTRRFNQAMAGRAPDARRIATRLRDGGGAALAGEPALQIAAADRPKLALAADAWLAWFDALFAEPGNTDAWTSERLEYSATVATSFGTAAVDQFHLVADEIGRGRLDWASFDLDSQANLGANAAPLVQQTVDTTVPAPITFRGAPAVRFWEIEDARLAWGLTPVGPTDLAHLMAIEYAGSYGNDWFVVPLTVPVGSLTRIDSLVVTDSFGVRTLMSPLGQAMNVSGAGFAMWQHATKRRAGEPATSLARNLLFVPPVTATTIDGAVLEEVVLLRDELANVAWAVEKSLESPTEQARAQNPLALPPPPAPAPGSPAAWRLASAVPENWVPLVPVQLPGEGNVPVTRLRRGAMLHADGTPRVHEAQSSVLASDTPLLLHDEEVPREGTRLLRQRRMARWSDGSTWVWTAFVRQAGRGEGSSGLVFDQAQEPGG